MFQSNLVFALNNLDQSDSVNCIEESPTLLGNQEIFPSDDNFDYRTIIPSIEYYSNGEYWYKSNPQVFFDWLTIIEDYQDDDPANNWNYIATGRFIYLHQEIKSNKDPTPVYTNIKYLRFNVYVRIESTSNFQVSNVNFDLRVTSSKTYHYSFYDDTLLLVKDYSNLGLKNVQVTYISLFDQISSLQSAYYAVDRSQLKGPNIPNWSEEILLPAIGDFKIEQLIEKTPLSPVYSIAKASYNLVQNSIIYFNRGNIINGGNSFNQDINFYPSEKTRIITLQSDVPLSYCDPKIDPSDPIIFSTGDNRYYDYCFANIRLHTKCIEEKQIYVDLKFDLVILQDETNDNPVVISSVTNQQITFELNYDYGYENHIYDNNNENGFCTNCGYHRHTIENDLCQGCGFEIHYNEQLVLNCRTDDATNQLNILPLDDYFYKVNVECSGEYHLETSSTFGSTLLVFDENMELVDITDIRTNNDLDFYGSMIVKSGIYYIRVINTSDTNQESINFTFGSRINDVRYIGLGTTVDALEHLHNGKNKLLFDVSDPGLYKIILAAYKNEQIVYPEGAIIVHDSKGNPVQKFDFSNYDNKAVSFANANNLIFFAELYTYYYIDINFNDEDLMGLELRIEHLHQFELNEDYYYVSDMITGDKIDILHVEKTGEYNIEVIYSGQQTEKLLFVILKENSDKSFTLLSASNDRCLLNNTNTTYSDDVILFAGDKIYIGYFNGRGNGTLFLSIESAWTQQFDLISDPNENVTCGTEVTLNGGAYMGTTITQGYTRVTYLDSSAPSSSRLDYFWYSSNTNVAIISEYGTITATGSGTVTITAVYKYDLTVIGKKEFIIIPDTNTEEVKLQYGMDVRVGGTTEGTEVTNHLGEPIPVSIDPYVSIHVGYTRLLCLGNDSPSPSIQHFDWAITPQSGETGLVNVSTFGTITGVTSGEITIKGTYRYNSRFIVIIKLHVI